MPTAIESRNFHQVPSMAKSTKAPPWGARDMAPSVMLRAPVMAPPTMVAGMMRSGSAAAKGMAPSLMKEAPSSQEARPFSCSTLVNSLGRSAVASASASGGTMPAAITAAITLKELVVPALSPAVANR